MKQFLESLVAIWSKLKKKTQRDIAKIIVGKK
jgi:hypothetical protein